tara:strand:- start:39 stop:542 length:504 start_codon:yes stop_codon:yes gene_type:complete
MALSKIQAESMNLADTFAFSGTVSGAGKVLQVKQSVIPKETITTSSASFTSIGHSLAITPSATSSRILIQVCGGACHAPYVSQFCLSTIYRGSTNLSSNGLETIGNSSSGLSLSPHNIVFLDSPSTTNEVTYTPYYRSQPTKPNVYFNLAGADGTDITITLTELAPN